MNTYTVLQNLILHGFLWAMHWNQAYEITKKDNINKNELVIKLLFSDSHQR